LDLSRRLLWILYYRGFTTRKGILLITIFPVIAGLVVNEIWAVIAHFLPLEAAMPIWLVQAALTVLLAYSYLRARSQDAVRAV
jgi:hypothetical protein